MKIYQVWDDLRKQSAVGIQKRITKTGPMKAYGCIDFNGRLGVRFEGPWNTQTLPNLEFIGLTLGGPSEVLRSLEAILKDDQLLPLFQILCDDLVKVAADGATSLQGIVDRLAHWQALLGDLNLEPLSIQKVRGLVAELVALKRLGNLIGLSSAILAWSGPMATPQDFYSAAFALEIKAVGPGAKRLHIQGVEQLELSYASELYLCLVVLASAGEGSNAALSLQSLVSGLRADLDLNLELYGELLGRLQAAGWRPDLDMNNLQFEILSFRIFHVTARFPRLLGAHVPEGVSNIRYDLDLTAINEYEVQTLPGELP